MLKLFYSIKRGITMHRKWVIITLLVINIISLLLLITSLIDLFEHGLQSVSTLKIGIIILFMGVINFTYVKY